MRFSTYHLFSCLVEKKKEIIAQGSLNHFWSKTVNNLPVTVGKGKNAGSLLLQSGEIVRKRLIKEYKKTKYEIGVPSAKAYWKVNVERNEGIMSDTEHPCFYLLEANYNQAKKKFFLMCGAFFESLSPIEVLLSNLNIKEEIIKLTPQEKRFLNNLLVTGELKPKEPIHNSSLHTTFFVESKIKPDSNLFDSNKYPEIADNTLNFIIPCHTPEEEEKQRRLMAKAFEQRGAKSFFKELRIFTLKHLLNGPFLVFQSPIK
ncbi:MAG: hypothetical protein ABSA44_08280 [Bacteroidota bacterium]|jgi:hypothetical protein